MMLASRYMRETTGVERDEGFYGSYILCSLLGCGALVPAFGGVVPLV